MTQPEAQAMADRLNAAVVEPGRSYEVARNSTCRHPDDQPCATCYKVGPYYVRMTRSKP